jgi:hypothetical protein
VTGYSESDGINRDVVGDERALQDRSSEPPGLGGKWCQERVKKSPSPVILSEAKNLQLFVFKKIKADSSLRSE